MSSDCETIVISESDGYDEISFPMFSDEWLKRTSVNDLINLMRKLPVFEKNEKLKVEAIPKGSSDEKLLLVMEIDQMRKIPSRATLEEAVALGSGALVEIETFGIFRREDIYRLRNMHTAREIGEEAQVANLWISENFKKEDNLKTILDRSWSEFCYRVSDEQRNLRIDIRTRDLISITSTHWMTDSVIYSTSILLAKKKKKMLQLRTHSS
jgi:hypothetical protein